MATFGDIPNLQQFKKTLQASSDVGKKADRDLKSGKADNNPHLKKVLEGQSSAGKESDEQLKAISAVVTESRWETFLNVMKQFFSFAVFCFTPWRHTGYFQRKLHWVVFIVALFGLLYYAAPPILRAGGNVYHTTSQYIEMSQLQAEVNRHSQQLGSALAERVKTIKNPTMAGISVSKLHGITVIAPTVRSAEWKKIEDATTRWAKREKYDAILFGVIYDSLGGEVLWSNYDGSNETDFGVIVESLRTKGLNNIFGFVSNPAERHLPVPFSRHIMGQLRIEQKPIKILWLWDTGKTYYSMSSNNMEGSIKSLRTVIELEDSDQRIKSVFKRKGVLDTTTELATSTINIGKEVVDIIKN